MIIIVMLNTIHLQLLQFLEPLGLLRASPYSVIIRESKWQQMKERNEFLLVTFNDPPKQIRHGRILLQFDWPGPQRTGLAIGLV
jgi:hypothetical protein